MHTHARARAHAHAHARTDWQTDRLKWKTEKVEEKETHRPQADREIHWHKSATVVPVTESFPFSNIDDACIIITIRSSPVRVAAVFPSSYVRVQPVPYVIWKRKFNARLKFIPVWIITTVNADVSIVSIKKKKKKKRHHREGRTACRQNPEQGFRKCFGPDIKTRAQALALGYLFIDWIIGVFDTLPDPCSQEDQIWNRNRPRALVQNQHSDKGVNQRSKDVTQA